MNLGLRVVHAFFTSWVSLPEKYEPLVAMLRGAIVNEHARDQSRDFIQSSLIGDPLLVEVELQDLVSNIGPVFQVILVPMPEAHSF